MSAVVTRDDVVFVFVALAVIFLLTAALVASFAGGMR